MALHPSISARLSLIEDLPSWREALADPAVQPRLQEYRTWEAAPALPSVETSDESIPGPHGPTTVRVYRPPSAPQRPRPGLVWVHGGGWVFGDLDMHEADWTAREVCARADAVVVSVDYRLAVDGVTYPVPHDDVVAGVRWVRENAAVLGIEPARLTVGGASAGANLAAGAVLRLRDDDNWLPATLVLAYATMHSVSPPLAPPLAEAFAPLPRMVRILPKDVTEMTANYLGGTPDPHGYAFPAGAVLDGLCPTLVLDAEYDDLRASSEAFAAALVKSGVPVRHVTVPGVLHGFLNLPSSVEPVDQALAVLAETVATAHAGELSPDQGERG
ncbi:MULTISPECIES: alpha/beta hydrolase [unclassified Streptomyces]|uniref:alpha/beta hydrolase n=1 Tax=unclassified Streptomyces TaxID=2593676 RepID=UPI002365F18F|nr:MULTISPECIES: alpha/beta hydrolase [unclassified Streptomyces]MDF3140444.1 alpha/beta hydrolase [Streptomyces sp. T21Q-yed]WDF35800.1 alpha/beta hydrolase [Streptomyces sp. T12]